MCTNFRSTSRSEKLRTNFRNFGRETCMEREMNFRRKFREIGSCRTCTWRVQTTKMCRTQSSCENSYTFSQGLSRNFVRIFVVQNLSYMNNITYELRTSYVPGYYHRSAAPTLFAPGSWPRSSRPQGSYATHTSSPVVWTPERRTLTYSA